MGTVWGTTQLGHVCCVIPGYAFKSSDWQTMGIPVVKIKNISSDNSVDLSTTDFVSATILTPRLEKYMIKDGDILLAMTGATAGKVGRVRTERKLLLNQRVAKIVPVEADPDFIWAVVSSQEYQQLFFRLADGSAQPNMSGGQIEGVEIPFPSIGVQQRIASILSAYDELIENSQRRIKILESMARALYREALTAEGEHVELLPIVESPYWRFISENVSKYTGAKRYLATADIDGLEVTGPGIDYLFAEKPSRAQKEPIPNSVWFARMKETYKIAWYGPSDDDRASGEVLSSGFAGFEARDAELWPLLFLILSSREFHVQKDLYCTGATQMSLTNEGLKRIVLPLPDEQSARRLGRSVGPMLNSIAGLQRKIENLRRTRDLLLPRLLSGQIEVEAIAS